MGGYLTSYEAFTLLYWETDQPYTLYGEASNETATDVTGLIVDG